MRLLTDFSLEPTERLRHGQLRTLANAMVLTTVLLALGSVYTTVFDARTAEVGRLIRHVDGIPWFLSRPVLTVASYLEGVDGLARRFLWTLTLGKGVIGWLDSSAHAAMKVRTETPPEVLEKAERKLKGFDHECAYFRRKIRRITWSARKLHGLTARCPRVGAALVLVATALLLSAGCLLVLTSALFMFV